MEHPPARGRLHVDKTRSTILHKFITPQKTPPPRYLGARSLLEVREQIVCAHTRIEGCFTRHTGELFVPPISSYKDRPFREICTNRVPSVQKLTDESVVIKQHGTNQEALTEVTEKMRAEIEPDSRVAVNNSLSIVQDP